MTADVFVNQIVHREDIAGRLEKLENVDTNIIL